MPSYDTYSKLCAYLAYIDFTPGRRGHGVNFLGCVTDEGTFGAIFLNDTRAISTMYNYMMPRVESLWWVTVTVTSCRTQLLLNKV